MKKTIFILAASIFYFSHATKAQVYNGSFETWSYDSTSWGYPPYIPVDTFNYWTPNDWTTINAGTDNRHIGKSLVFNDSLTAKYGSHCVKMVTDSFALNLTGVGSVTATLPGLILNGSFKLDLSGLLSAGQLTPASIVGAGTAVSGPKKKFSLWVKYTPVPNDSMLIWAVLKKGSTVVAQAKTSHISSDTGFVLIEKDFVYTSCVTPDSVVIMITSSTPNFSNLLTSLTTLPPGSVALVDSVSLTDFGPGENIGPIAAHDHANTPMDSSVNIVVLANDTDCSTNLKGDSIVTPPLHGHAVVQADKSITYTPDSAYLGKDSFFYAAIDTFGSSVASVGINVLYFGAGINQVNEVSFNVSPNPTSGILSVEIDGKDEMNLSIFDLLGQQLNQQKITGSKNRIDISAYNNGIYFLQLKNNSGQLLGTRKIILQR